MSNFTIAGMFGNIARQVSQIYPHDSTDEPQLLSVTPFALLNDNLPHDEDGYVVTMRLPFRPDEPEGFVGESNAGYLGVIAIVDCDYEVESVTIADPYTKRTTFHSFATWDQRPAQPVAAMTIEDWSKKLGVQILDPDGFDRTDHDLYYRLFTEEEFRKGLQRSTQRTTKRVR
jgi:hypothetical protein